MLSAIFFDLATPNSLTLQSAVASGSLGVYRRNSSANSNADGALELLSVPNLAAPGSTNGGPGAFYGGWQYNESANDFTNLTQYRGLGTNGLGGIFNGADVMDVDNLDYALTSAEDDVARSQAKQLFNFPLIKNTITFTLSGLPDGFVLDSTAVSNVRFQYGTKLDEPNIADPTGDPVPPLANPELASITIWSILATVLGLRARQVRH